MLVYRITSEKYSKKLSSSGAANRWNKEGEFVIYSAESRSLASLELVVHRSSIKPNIKYKVLVIDVDIKKNNIRNIDEHELPKNWRSISAYNKLQSIGSTWYENREQLILKIPSAVIPKENNFIINTQHEYFKSKVKILHSENYFWDERLL